MKKLKYSEIIAENKKLNKKLQDSNIQSYRIGILSNIMLHQAKDIGEYILRKENILAEIKFGDYDNICQDSERFNDQNAIIIFWELCNIVDGIQYKIDNLSNSKINDLLDKINREMCLVFENLREVPLVIINKFSSLIFTQNHLDFQPLKKFEININDILNNFANKYSNIKIIDIDKIIAKEGIKNSIDLRFFYSSKTLYNIEFIKNYFFFIYPLLMAPNGKTKKALILDCDNTLWKGIISEDGISNIKIFSEIQHLIKTIAKRGILIGICSKNNYSEIDKVFKYHEDMILKDEDIVIKKINWNDKASNLREISKELNISLDSIVFVDDSDFEINLIRQELPMINVMQVPKKNHEYPMMFRELINQFYNSTQTIEDIKRVAMYKSNIKRKKLNNIITNLDDYLISLSLKVKYYLNDQKIIGRMAQLTQKTNQFNLTTKRYSEKDIEDFVKDINYLVIAIEVNDKFGNNGIVGLCIIKQEKEIAEFDTLLMSCRVLGRKIEYKFMDIIIQNLQQRGVEVVFSEYQATLKNEQVKGLYDIFGFKKVKETEKYIKYNLYLKNYICSKTDFIEVLHQN